MIDRFDAPDTTCVQDVISDVPCPAVAPIYMSTVYDIGLTDHAVHYPRSLNTPTQCLVAQKLAHLEHADACILLGSGSAAIATVLMSLLKPGDHLVAACEIYSGTRDFVDTELLKWGVTCTWVYAATVDAFESARQKNTRVLFIETPGNPLLTVFPLAGLADWCRGHGVVSVVDNTLATPINQTPLTSGIDIVVHSGSKYLNGHSDVVCGAICAAHTWIEAMRPTAIRMGATLSAMDAYLLNRSLKTLSLRIRQHNSNAQAVATYLAQHSEVETVYYPGLATHPQHALATQQMRGFGGVVTCQLGSQLEASLSDRLSRLHIIRHANSFGGVESVVGRPFFVSHRKISEGDRLVMGISPTMLRISVGLESVADILADLERMLAL